MVEVIRTGLYDTIQDLGRVGCQEFGIPFSGVMDSYSATLANAILGNDENDAVIECVYSGPKLKFLVNTRICITGAQMSATVNGEAVKRNTSILIKSNDVLSFGRLIEGCRVYVAVYGGFLNNKIFGSRSLCKGITENHKLLKGDIIDISVTNNIINLYSSIRFDQNYFLDDDIEAFKGPEFELLTKEQQLLLFSKSFTVSNDSNRMGYQFIELLDNSLTGIITSLVLPGTIQLTPSGKLIVLMRDCQVTGGYPRVLQLTDDSINKLSQKVFGLKIQFKSIN